MNVGENVNDATPGSDKNNNNGNQIVNFSKSSEV